MPFSQVSVVMLELCPQLFWKPKLGQPSLTKPRGSHPDTARGISRPLSKNKAYNMNNLLAYKELLFYIIYNGNI